MRRLEFNLQPSPHGIFFLTLFFLSTLSILFITPRLHVEKYVMAFILILYGCHILWRYGLLRHRASLIHLKLSSEGKWHVRTPHASYQATLEGSSILTSFILILRFRIKGKWFPWTCLVLRDSMPADHYRQLISTILTDPLAKVYHYYQSQQK
jgi:hypothetical protein